MVREGLNQAWQDIIIIEDSAADDLAAVIEIERMSFSTPWSETSFFNEMKKPKSFLKVAKKGGKVVGYICGGWIIDEGHILDVAVHPEYRRLSIASMLVSLGIERLRKEGCRFVFLEVRSANEPAARMYSKFGFEIIGTRKDYYTSPVEDAVIMMLKFAV
jgi:ribosomal-protein-alanine N-acetyltransferase